MLTGVNQMYQLRAVELQQSTTNYALPRLRTILSEQATWRTGEENQLGKKRRGLDVSSLEDR